MATCSCGAKLSGKRRKCDACNAGANPAPEVTIEPKSAVDELQDRGRALWVALGQKLDTAAGQLALEACRSADRLDELDRVIAGKGVLKLMVFRLGEPWFDQDDDQHVHVTVGFQSVLAEARQQQATFKALLVELGLRSEPGEVSQSTEEASPLAKVLALVQAAPVPAGRPS